MVKIVQLCNIFYFYYYIELIFSAHILSLIPHGFG